MLAIQQLRGEQSRVNSYHCKYMQRFIVVESLAPITVDDREKDLFELPDTHLRSQLADDENE